MSTRGSGGGGAVILLSTCDRWIEFVHLLSTPTTLCGVWLCREISGGLKEEGYMGSLGRWSLPPTQGLLRARVWPSLCPGLDLRTVSSLLLGGLWACAMSVGT